MKTSTLNLPYWNEHLKESKARKEESLIIEKWGEKPEKTDSMMIIYFLHDKGTKCEGDYFSPALR